jgi:hypothetical protein
MNNKFLNKVIEQIISETRLIDNKLHTPFSSPSPSFLPRVSYFLFTFSLPHPLFSEHCENVYGLNNDEIDYVWKEYKAKMNNKELV